jgi:aminoglycoside phosphotransferase (APT) family kinase protein
MKSRTKYIASDEEIKKLFEKHGFGPAENIAPLGDGEFNAAFKVTCGGKDYALKIAPPENASVLNYEYDMMKSEVFWYEKMEKNTHIRIPKVYAVDFTKEVIASNCFIMEMLKGEPLSKTDVTDEERDRIAEQKIEMLAQIHAIKGEDFGYIQKGLYDNWYEALKSMASNLVKDCNELGKSTPDGERFLELLDKQKSILSKAPCRMVNFDLWDSNVLYLGESLAWIDPERSFWGDPVADFITLGKGQKTPLDEKIKEIEIYNKYASEKISAGREECIRYAAAVAYLALIEEVEKYVRYEPDEPNYIRNTVDARDMYDMAFKVLDAD